MGADELLVLGNVSPRSLGGLGFFNLRRDGGLGPLGELAITGGITRGGDCASGRLSSSLGLSLELLDWWRDLVGILDKRLRFGESFEEEELWEL